MLLFSSQNASQELEQQIEDPVGGLRSLRLQYYKQRQEHPRRLELRERSSEMSIRGVWEALHLAGASWESSGGGSEGRRAGAPLGRDADRCCDWWSLGAAERWRSATGEKNVAFQSVSAGRGHLACCW